MIIELYLFFEDAAPETTEAVYLKLYALSTGKAALRSLNLTGAFGEITQLCMGWKSTSGT